MARVKQRVDVGSKEQAIIHRLRARLRIAEDVRGLKRRFCVTLSYRTATPVGNEQLAPKLRLSLPLRDGSQDLLGYCDFATFFLRRDLALFGV
jgi:hypothetical protein